MAVASLAMFELELLLDVDDFTLLLVASDVVVLAVCATVFITLVNNYSS